MNRGLLTQNSFFEHIPIRILNALIPERINFGLFFVDIFKNKL